MFGLVTIEIARTITCERLRAAEASRVRREARAVRGRKLRIFRHPSN